MRPIDADVLLEAIEKERQYLLARGQMGAEHILVHNFRNLVEDAPSIPLSDYKEGYRQAILDGKTNYSRPRGKWIKKVDEVGFVSYICSECGAEIEVEDCSDDKFCFNCGAIMREDDNEHTDPIIKAIQENNVKYDERPSIDFSRISCDLGESNEVKRKSDNLPSCNSCLHNGTWDCIKCKGFDKYEKRGGAE